MGINVATAKTITISVIPLIISKLTLKTAEPNDSSFNITDILGKLSGGADSKYDVSDIIGCLLAGKVVLKVLKDYFR